MVLNQPEDTLIRRSSTNIPRQANLAPFVFSTAEHLGHWRKIIWQLCSAKFKISVRIQDKNHQDFYFMEFFYFVELVMDPLIVLEPSSRPQTPIVNTDHIIFFLLSFEFLPQLQSSKAGIIMDDTQLTIEEKVKLGYEAQYYCL